jgi:hypothetical protein
VLAAIISHDASRASALFRDEQSKEREEQEYSTVNGRLHPIADLDLQLCMHLSYSNSPPVQTIRSGPIVEDDQL